MGWTKEEKNAYMKAYHAANKEKIAENQKAYYAANKEIRAAYYAANKEKIAENQKAYSAANKEKRAVYDKKYQQSPAGTRLRIIRDWKKNGLTPPPGYTMYELYDEIYLPCGRCMVCNSVFKNSSDRCADHDHDLIENNFRQVLCQKCNLRDSWKQYSEWV